MKQLTRQMREHPEVQRTLKDLKLEYNCREVVDKDAEAVLDEIEAAMYAVALTILEVRSAELANSGPQ